ncbi:MAG: hypothetical protein KQJ78_10480 [Deltaproteobacteria bacterium]|nr:hypothetical protein [Deltaproteobacteria bacterium]
MRLSTVEMRLAWLRWRQGLTRPAGLLGLAGAASLAGVLVWAWLAGYFAPVGGPDLMFSPAARHFAETHGTWSRVLDPADGRFDPAAWGFRYPVAAWCLWLEVLGLAAWPLTSLVTAAPRRGGWLLAKFSGLLLTAYLAWLPASLGLGSFGRTSLLAALGAVILAAAAAAWRQRAALGQALTRGWRELLVGEGAFWLLFALGLALRLGNPDLWHPWFGGEKPMDLALLNAVVRAVHFPPPDPWFAGGYLNYYYFGQVLAGSLVLFTGAPVPVAYNLALAAWFAFTGVGAVAVGEALYRRLSGRDSPERSWAAGGLAAGLTLLIGNLAQGRVAARWLAGARLGGWQWYWDASRAIPAPRGEAQPITEFPLFSFLYGDLHAHLLAFPLFLGLLALAVHRLPAPGRAAPPAGAWLGAAALCLGALGVTNTWDLPAGLCLVAAGLLAAAWAGGWAARGRALAGAGLTAGLAWLLFWPYHHFFRSAYAGLNLWTGSRTPLDSVLLIHGLFLFVGLAWLLARPWWLGPAPRRSLTVGWWLLALAGAGTLGLAGEWPAAVAWGLGAPALGWFLADTRPAAWRLALLLWLLPLAQLAGVEHLALQGDIGRMNTVFKFYLEMWLVWAGLAGALAVWLWDLPRPAARRAFRVGFLILAGASLLYPLTAAPARWADRLASAAGLTLDGRAFLASAWHRENEREFPLKWDLRAMEWLEESVAGRPVIAEAQLPQYHWAARYSSQTGLPTILGWPWHETQQRAAVRPNPIPGREADVAALYHSTDPRVYLPILRKYRVAYVIVGPVERAVYPAAGLAKFAAERGRYWDAVYQNPGVTIYRMRPLPPAPEARP